MTKQLTLAAAFTLTVMSLSVASAQPAPQPWKEPQDTIAALFDPDRYAWQLFVALSWPANTATKEADPAKAFGAPGPVVWETWRNVRPNAPDTVFPQNGSDPGPWLSGGSPAVARQERQFDRVPIKQFVAMAMRQRTSPRPSPEFDEAVGEFNEVRLNLSTYDFIRDNKLYNIEGQVAQFNAGKDNLNFPGNAKEVKAQWRQIAEADKPRYHWAEVTRDNGVKEVWELTALHITTKDLPNWFWTTFEHIDNKQAGWLTTSVDRFACPTPPHDCEQAPPGIGLQGTKWEHYRLRGTQVNFIDSIGTATLLANSQIESPFQRQSSCITCHALATIDRTGDQDLGCCAPLSGAPRPEWFQDPRTRQRIFMQLDFVWSLRRASRIAPSP